MTNREFIESLADLDALIEHDAGTCGHCYMKQIQATTARDMLVAGELDNAPSVWSQRCHQAWEESKFWKLWQSEASAGNDPQLAFGHRGWTL